MVLHVSYTVNFKEVFLIPAKKKSTSRKTAAKKSTSKKGVSNTKKLSRFDKELKEHRFRVSIFGSARIKPEDKTYKDVRKLAELVAAEGCDVVTGGGPGLMEAANEGVAEGRFDKGVHSVGLGIKLPHEQSFNPHLDIKKEFNHFSHRLDTFMVLSNVVIVAPGGVGTLLEFFYTWQLSQVKHICPIPIILYGKMWNGLIDWIKKQPLHKKFLNKADLDNIHICTKHSEIMEIIRDAHLLYLEHGDDICLNHKKYQIKYKK